MSLAYKKLLKEYGDPHNSMAAKEFRRDLARLVQEIKDAMREKCAKAGYEEAKAALRPGVGANIAQATAQCVAAVIRKVK